MKRLFAAIAASLVAGAACAQALLASPADGYTLMMGSNSSLAVAPTAEDGGSAHALADNRPLAVDYIADWIGERLR